MDCIVGLVETAAGHSAKAFVIGNDVGIVLVSVDGASDELDVVTIE